MMWRCNFTSMLWFLDLPSQICTNYPGIKFVRVAWKKNHVENFSASAQFTITMVKQIVSRRCVHLTSKRMETSHDDDARGLNVVKIEQNLGFSAWPCIIMQRSQLLNQPVDMMKTAGKCTKIKKKCCAKREKKLFSIVDYGNLSFCRRRHLD